MKHTLETRNQFVELRAQGYSLRNISAKIDVPKSTLDRWDDDCLTQIQRLRALEWEAVEEELGRRLEDDLKGLAGRIRKWEAELDQIDPECYEVSDVLKVIRECRREYTKRRAIIMAPLERRSSQRSSAGGPQSAIEPVKSSPSSPNANPGSADATHDEQSGSSSSILPGHHSADSAPVRSAEPTPEERDKTGQNPNPAPATPLSTNDLQQLPTSLSHSVGAAADTVPTEPKEHSAPIHQDSPPQKKHQPYWLNGHYYANPEIPYHVARAISGKRRSG